MRPAVAQSLVRRRPDTMRLLGTLTIAFRSINRNKMRSFLTMLGIVIGVAAVIAMLAVGQGARDSINAQIQGLGTNVIIIMPGARTQGGARMEAGAASRLTEEDVQAIRQNCPSVSMVSPIARSGVQVKYGGQNWRTSVYGGYPSYLPIRDWEPSVGVNFSESDERSANKVCLVGKTVAENLFGEDADPVGMVLRVNDLPFKIIGLLSSKGQNAMGQDQDDLIVCPFSTVQKKILGETRVRMLTISAVSQSAIEAARQEINETLMTRRKGSEGDGSDYTIRTQTDISDMATATSKTLGMLLASIACVSLLVGGIGIMNIMLVSVTERTREIGIRMAVGAKGKDVLLQFLVEALVLSFFGGILGIAAGAGSSWVISVSQGWAITISPWSILLGFGFSAATGVFFGWYPARKASRMNPIEALRYE
jgi:putative ABC transport system permease protein